MVWSQHGKLETKIDGAIVLACKTQFFDNLLFLVNECFEIKPERDYDPRFLYIYSRFLDPNRLLNYKRERFKIFEVKP